MDSPLETSGEYENFSQDSNLLEDVGNHQIRRIKTHKYKKNSWLQEFFDYYEGGKVSCKLCNVILANLSHSRQIKHLETSHPNYKSRVMVEMDTDTINDKINMLFTKCIIRGNWSFRSTETKEIRLLVKTLQSKEGQNWKIPPRQEISSTYMPRYSKNLLDKFQEAVRESNIMTLTVMFDHWSDGNQRHYMGVIAVAASGKRFLLDLVDHSLAGQTSDVMLEDLKKVLATIPSRAINALVSDNAPNCAKTRRLFASSEHYTHVIVHRCLAHLMNCVGDKTTGENGVISKAMQEAASASKVLRADTYWINKISDMDMTRPVKATKTRWYSTITQLSALIDLESVIVEDIIPKFEQDGKYAHASTLENIDWSLLKDIYSVLKPLAECIAQVERHDASLGEGIRFILIYAKQLFAGEHGNGRDSNITVAKKEAMKAFIWYFNENYIGKEEFSLYLAAYSLDRRFKLDYLTEHALTVTFESIARIAVIKGKAPLEQLGSTLLREFEHYKEFTCGYGVTDEEQMKWWAERATIGLLPNVGLRLAHLKASSANIERAFSSINYMQGSHRLNMSSDTLVHCARARIALTDGLNVRESKKNTELLEELEDLSFDGASSTITQHNDIPHWLDDQDRKTWVNYRSFFQYFDFAKVNEAPQDLHQRSVTEREFQARMQMLFQKENIQTEIVDIDEPMRLDDI